MKVVAIKCEACRGKGEVVWETTFCEYELGECPVCDGTGTEKPPQPTDMDIRAQQAIESRERTREDQ